MNFTWNDLRNRRIYLENCSAANKPLLVMPSNAESLQLQCSLFIALHKHDIFSVAPRNFFHGKTKNYVWHCALPRMENGFATPKKVAMCGCHSHCHAWVILQAIPHAVMRKHTIFTVFKLICTVLLTSNSCFTGMHGCAPYQLCLLWISSQQL